MYPFVLFESFFESSCVLNGSEHSKTIKQGLCCINFDVKISVFSHQKPFKTTSVSRKNENFGKVVYFVKFETFRTFWNVSRIKML